MEINQIASNFIYPLLAGLIGGFVSSLITLMLYPKKLQQEERHRLDKERYEAIRGLLEKLNLIYWGVNTDWKRPINNAQSPEEFIADLSNHLNRSKLLFSSDKETLEIIEEMRHLLAWDSRKLGSRYDSNSPQLDQIINDLENRLKKKMQKIENRIT